MTVLLLLTKIFVCHLPPPHPLMIINIDSNKSPLFLAMPRKITTIVLMHSIDTPVYFLLTTKNLINLSRA